MRSYCDSAGCTLLENTNPSNLGKTLQNFSSDLMVLDTRVMDNRTLSSVKNARAAHRVPLIGLGKQIGEAAEYEHKRVPRRSGKDRRKKTDRRATADLSLNSAGELERGLATTSATDEHNSPLQIDDRTKELLVNGVAVHLSPK